MATFQVLVNIEMIATYIVKAESQTDAEREALDRAHDGMGQSGWDLQSADIYDVADETAEHE